MPKIASNTEKSRFLGKKSKAAEQIKNKTHDIKKERGRTTKRTP